MNKRAWLFSGLSSALVVGLMSVPAAAADDGDAKPPHAEEEEGPFAPKGRTGKLREETAAVTPKSEGGEAPDRAAEKPGYVGLDFVHGFGKTVNAATPTVANDLTVESVILGGKYHLNPTLAFGLRIPYSSGTVKGNTGQKDVSASPLGNIEIEGEYTLTLGPSTRLPIGLALALPTAQGDEFASTDPSKVSQAAINEVAAGARGFEDDALFAWHRLGFIPRAGLEYEEGAIRTGGYTKLELMFKAGGEALPQSLTDLGFKQNSLAFTWVTGGEFFYEIGKFEVGARAWIALLLKDPLEASTDANSSSPSKLQFAAEPAVRAKFGPVRAGLSYIWPIGGRLGGDNSMGGIRLLAGVVF